MTVGAFATSTTFQGSLTFLFSIARTHIFILHLPMINVDYPANVLMIYKILIPIFTFDVLDSDWTTGLVMEFDEE